MDEKLRIDERFERGIAYEALMESLNNEMARHNTLAQKLGEESDAARQHLDAMAALAEVRKYLDPQDEAQLEIVGLMLRSNEADRHPEAAA